MSDTTTGRAVRHPDLERRFDDWEGDVQVYRLYAPYAPAYDLEDGEPVTAVDWVVVSAVSLQRQVSVPITYGTSETMIFPYDPDTDHTDFGELVMLPFKDHTAAVRELGYEVA